MKADHIVYLDCDQVFSDFITGSLAAINYPWKGIRSWPDGWTYDFFQYAGTSREEVDKLCTVDFWENLPWTEDGKEILAEVWKRFWPNEIMLLTKPMENDDSYTGKARWVGREIPELRERIVPTHIAKSEFAFDFNCLLIDDSQENCQDFICAGGAAILVPRPWNSYDQLFYEGKAVSQVVKCMDKWIDLVNHPAKERKEIVC